MLAKSKLNSTETLVSQAQIDMEISHEEFITILKEKENVRRWWENARGKIRKCENVKMWECEKMKETVRNVSEKLEEKAENMRLNSVNSRN